jgi:hypothetical protein
MTMEDKEIKFWSKYELVPPFLKECGMGDWEDIKQDYFDRMAKEKELGVDKEREAYSEALDKLTNEEIDKFIDEGEMPASILKIVDIDPKSNDFVSKTYSDVIIGSINDIIDKQWDHYFDEITD